MSREKWLRLAGLLLIVLLLLLPSGCGAPEEDAGDEQPDEAAAGDEQPGEATEGDEQSGSLKGGNGYRRLLLPADSKERCAFPPAR